MNLLQSFGSMETNLYPIFILVLIISSNFLAETFPCRFQEMMTNNIFFKQLFGFLTMIFFVTMTLDEYSDDYSFSQLVSSSLLMYFGFIVLSKTSTKFFFPALFLLGVLYILHIRKTRIQNTLQKYEVNKDDTETTKNIDIQQQMSSLETMNTYSSWISKLAIGIITFGFLVYFGEKKVEYKKDFNFLTFLFGKTNCKGKSPNVSVMKALKNIV